MVLGVVSRDYQVVTNHEAVQIAREVCAKAFPGIAPLEWEAKRASAPRTLSYAFIDLMHRTRDGERMVAQNESFVCFAPFASRHPFELWILPKRRDAHFARIDQQQMHDLAAILKETLLRLDLCLGDPPYNYALLTTAFSNDFHWHIEIIPRLAIAGGFEFGTGIYINTVAPEQAATYLREVGLPEMSLSSARSDSTTSD